MTPLSRGSAADPAVAYDLQGNAYATGLSYAVNSAVQIQKSADNGKTWDAPQIAAPQMFSEGTIDKDWLVVDTTPTSPFANSLYVCVEQRDVRNNSLISVCIRMTVATHGRPWPLSPSRLIPFSTMLATWPLGQMARSIWPGIAAPKFRPTTGVEARPQASNFQNRRMEAIPGANQPASLPHRYRPFSSAIRVAESMEPCLTLAPE